MSRLDLSDWRVEHYRFTVFPAVGASPARSPDWWQQLTGELPEEATSNPRTGSGQVSGGFGDGKLTLRLEPERIDWVFGPRDTALAHGTSLELPMLGDVTEKWSIFKELVERWLGQATLPEVSRLAFGATLLHPEADRRSGYERLPAYLPVDVSPESSDFLFQLNLPLADESETLGFRVNRLSKWNVMAFRTFALGTDGSASLREPSFLFRVELDINTVPDPAANIPEDRVQPLFEVLSREGFRLVTNGLRSE